jgi:hypothetical protein
MAGKGFALPRSFRGDKADLRVVSRKNWEALVTHLNRYVPFLDENGDLQLTSSVITTDGIVIDGTKLGFYGATAIVRPDVTGSRGANAALASLLTELANLGLITDSST